MARITITIETNSDAFQYPSIEVVRILDALMTRLNGGNYYDCVENQFFTLKDVNGNTVGSYEVTDD